MPTSAEKDKSNSKVRIQEDDTEDDSYVRKTIGVLLDTRKLK
ncbi:hypothetical protein RHH80_03045 [Clostridioides difficile]|nr:hypothetical protein [Clostridioides difficile]